MTGTRTVSKKANRINVKNLVYTLVLSDTEEGTTYGDVRKIGPAMQVQLTPSLSSGVLFGDGVQQENIAKLNGIAMVLDANKIKIEDRADMLGHKYENGVLIEAAGDEAPYIAVGYIVDETNQCKEYVWLLKGRAQPFNSSVQQSTDNLNFSTDSITINFIPRDSDGQLRYFADSANESLTADQISKWFVSGPSKPVVVSAQDQNEETTEQTQGAS